MRHVKSDVADFVCRALKQQISIWPNTSRCFQNSTRKTQTYPKLQRISVPEAKQSVNDPGVAQIFRARLPFWAGRRKRKQLTLAQKALGQALELDAKTF